MIFPDFPHFEIPPGPESWRRRMSLAEYHEWVTENVRELQRRGLYRKLRDTISHKPVDARFRLIPDTEPRGESR